MKFVANRSPAESTARPAGSGSALPNESVRTENRFASAGVADTQTVPIAHAIPATARNIEPRHASMCRDRGAFTAGSAWPEQCVPPVRCPTEPVEDPTPTPTNAIITTVAPSHPMSTNSLRSGLTQLPAESTGPTGPLDSHSFSLGKLRRTIRAHIGAIT